MKLSGYTVSREVTDHPLAPIAGVAEDDDVFIAAEKTIAAMRRLNVDPRVITRAERMYAEARLRVRP